MGWVFCASLRMNLEHKLRDIVKESSKVENDFKAVNSTSSLALFS